jgi:hypothetical protein
MTTASHNEARWRGRNAAKDELQSEGWASLQATAVNVGPAWSRIPNFAGADLAALAGSARPTLAIDLPAVKAEVEAAFAAYERALVTNDVPTLDRLFLDAPTTIRFGAAENLFGYAEIAAFRAGRSAAGLARVLERTVITTYGHDFAVAATLFRRGPGTVGRQMQVWVRTDDGWRVAAAHVSLIDDPG